MRESGENIDLSVCKSLGSGRWKEIKAVALNADETPFGLMYSSDNPYFRKKISEQKKGKTS